VKTALQPAPAFSKFAGTYDAFMDYIDYPGWVRYACDILNLYGIKGKRLLDIACGTGTCAILFAGEGFEVTGLDASPQMLERARGKPEAARLGIKFICRDMREFRIEEKVHAVTSFYDSLNYLLQEEDLKKAFVCAHRALEDGGIFIFDMNTEYALKEIWGNTTTHRREGGVPSVWRNEYDAETGIGTLNLSWAVKENGQTKDYCEIHRERAYSNSGIKALLREAGFREIAVYAHRTFLPPAEVTPRIMVAAVK